MKSGLVFVLAVSMLVSACSSEPSKGSGQKYNVLSADTPAKGKSPVSLLAAHTMVPNQAIDEGRVKDHAAWTCRHSNVNSMKVYKTTIAKFRAANPGYSNNGFNDESEVYVTEVAGDIQWPFIDPSELKNDEDRARFKGGRIVFVHSTEDGCVIWSQLYKV